jgi:hypothetical protein
MLDSFQTHKNLSYTCTNAVNDAGIPLATLWKGRVNVEVGQLMRSDQFVLYAFTLIV